MIKYLKIRRLVHGYIDFILNSAMTGCGACSKNCWICSHATRVPGVLSSPAPVLFLGWADLSAFRQECGCHGVSSSLIVRIYIYSRASRLPVTGHRFSVMRFCWPPFGHLIAPPPITASLSVVDGHSGSRVAAFLLTVCSVFGSNGPCDAGLRVAVSTLPQELMGAHRQCVQEVLKALL